MKILSSNKADVEEKVSEKTATHTDVRPPSLYKVLLMNDDFTPMDFVIEILQKFFDRDESAAVDIMLQVHHQGFGVAGVYQYDIAETKVHQVHSYSKAHQHPLRCTLESE